MDDALGTVGKHDTVMPVDGCVTRKGETMNIGRYPVNEGYAWLLGLQVIFKKPLLYVPATVRGQLMLQNMISRHISSN